MALTLNNYIQRTENVQDKTRIELHGDHLSKKGTSALSRFFMNKTGDKDVNRATVNDFLKAVKAQHGSHVMEVVKGMDFIQNAVTKGKPLTARMIREAVQSAADSANNIQNTNKARVQEFKNDAGPNGLQEMVRTKARELGMEWFAKTTGEVEALSNALRIPESQKPFGGQSLREAALEQVTQKLNQAKTVHAQNQNVLKEFEKIETGLIAEILAAPLATPLELGGAKMTITLKDNFTPDELSALVSAAKKQIREMTGSSTPMTLAELKGALTVTLTRPGETPPNPALIGTIDTRLTQLGVLGETGMASQIKSLAVMYGLHSEKGMEKGLSLAKELSGKLENLGNITDPAVLLRELGDLAAKLDLNDPKAESVGQLLPFAFKSAMVLAGETPGTAKKIFDVLCGPVAKALEGPMARWNADMVKNGQPSREFMGINGTHLALQNAAREAALLRTTDQSVNAASLLIGKEAKVADIPDAILARMARLGAPCGTTGPMPDTVKQLFTKLTDTEIAQVIRASQGQKLDSLFSRDSKIDYGALPGSLIVKLFGLGCQCGVILEGGRPTIASLARIAPEMVVAIIKLCQGDSVNPAIIALISNYLTLDPHNANHGLPQIYEGVTGTRVPDPLPQSLTTAMNNRAIPKLLQDHFPDVTDATARDSLTTAFGVGLANLGMSVPAIVAQIKSNKPLGMDALSANSLPSLGEPVSIERELATIQSDVARDIGRRAMRGGYSIDFGNGTTLTVAHGGANLPDDEKANFRDGNLEKNIFARKVLAEIDTLCGDNAAQKGAVASLFTASPLVLLRGVGALMHKLPTDGAVHEHSPFDTTLQKQPDGSIRGTLSLTTDTLTLRMAYLVQPDGSNKMVDLHMGRNA